MDQAFDAAINPSIVPNVVYRDAKRMYRWLEDAFGFEPHGIILDGEGNVMHAEMKFGNGYIMIGYEWNEAHRSPASIGGVNSQTCHLRLAEDIDAHCARARAGGAEILAEPEDQFYGDRTYRARDIEGHFWVFRQTVKAVASEEWDANLGVTTTKRLPE